MKRLWLTLVVLCITANTGIESGVQAQQNLRPAPQTIFLNRAPGSPYDQNRPESLDDKLLLEPIEKVGTRGLPERRLGLSFVLSYFNGPLDTVDASLQKLLALSLKHEIPVLIVLDGENWWDYRSDLWNWWDPARPGYNPKNAVNVEWTDWGSEHAVKIAWRNWGRQIRVLPPPNLAAPRFRDASRAALLRLVHTIKQWADALPAEKRFLFPGVKIGWEASLGVNAFHYPNGNVIAEQYPNDTSHDPKQGLDMQKDFAGGLVPLGYAALTAKGWKHNGPVTLADQERITADYLAFLASVCRKAGLKREQIFTHAGGQFAPYPLHYSHRVAINANSLPGWSLYGTFPEAAGDLDASLAEAKITAWAAAEWLPNATTPEEWETAYRRTLGFRDCRFVSVYNWEGIRENEAALAGLRRALSAP